MVPHSLNGAYSAGGSQVLWEDGERVFRCGWRLDDNGKRRAVLIVLPAAGISDVVKGPVRSKGRSQTPRTFRQVDAKRVFLRALWERNRPLEAGRFLRFQKELRMGRIERTEVFRRHIICATACLSPGAGSRRRWRVSVSAVELGGAGNTPMLQFPTLEQDDPATALDSAIQSARKQLATASRT
jgi:hypothetical protein